MSDVPIIAVYHDEKEQSCQVRLVSCSMPAEGYGIVLHDIARQVAKMFAQQGGFDEHRVLVAILSYFDAERAKPTSDVYVRKLDG